MFQIERGNPLMGKTNLIIKSMLCKTLILFPQMLWILTKLVERTNEVSLVGRVGLQCVNERAGCLPFWDSSLLRPWFVQTDVHWLRFGSFSIRTSTRI